MNSLDLILEKKFSSLMKYMCLSINLVIFILLNVNK